MSIRSIEKGRNFNPFKLALKRDPSVCKKCSYPDGYQASHLLPKGICNICDTYETNRDILGDFTRLQLLFGKKMEELRAGTGSGFDCLVLFSGGKDSSYILWSIVEKYGLTPLAFTFNWGFQSDLARENMQRVTKKLGVNHILFTPNQDFLLAMRKNFMLVQDEFCRPCMKLIFSHSFRFASALGIPVIISGLSREQSLCSIDGLNEAVGLINHLENPSGEFLRRAAEICVKPTVLLQGVRTEAEKGKLDRTIYRIPQDQQAQIPLNLQYFVFHPYSEDAVIAKIVEKVGWVPPQTRGIFGHTDCMMERVAEWVYPMTRNSVGGEHKKYRELASMVRMGNLTLAEASQIVEGWNKAPKPERELRELLELLNLAPAEVPWLDT